MGNRGVTEEENEGHARKEMETREIVDLHILKKKPSPLPSDSARKDLARV
jgi:hypothetical protein